MASVARQTRIGLVGINERARRLLLPGLTASPRARVIAICSRDMATAQVAAAQVGSEARAFSRVEDMLASGVVDALYLNTPLETHVRLCRAAIGAAVGVICEKPLALTADEAAALAEEAEHAGVRTVVNFTYRSVPGFRLTGRWLREHDLGRPLHARFELLQGHNFMPSFVHGSALLDSGCHLFDVMSSLLADGGFGHIAAVLASPLSDQQPDYGWSFLGRTESGVVVSALFSRSALGWRNGLRWSLSGEMAALEVELDSDRMMARTARRGDGAPYGVWRDLPLPDDIIADDERFPAYHLDRLVGALRGEESFPGFHEALATNRLAEALAASAREGKWVSAGPPGYSGQPGQRAQRAPREG